MVVPRLSGDDTSVAGDNDRDENDDRDKNTKNAAKEAR
jgi:hypothetical protein